MRTIKAKQRKFFYQRYKNLCLLVGGISFAAVLYQIEEFHFFLESFGNLGYIGAFLTGFLAASSFTAAIALVVLLILAEKLSPLELSLLAAFGSMAGDFFIFRLVKDGLVEEIRPLFDRFNGKHLQALIHSHYFSWTLPVLGAIIIASPLPDELGVSLLGISKMNNRRFLLLSFVLNFIGIFTIITTAHLLTS